MPKNLKRYGVQVDTIGVKPGVIDPVDPMAKHNDAGAHADHTNDEPDFPPHLDEDFYADHTNEAGLHSNIDFDGLDQKAKALGKQIKILEKYYYDMQRALGK